MDTCTVRIQTDNNDKLQANFVSADSLRLMADAVVGQDDVLAGQLYAAAHALELS